VGPVIRKFMRALGLVSFLLGASQLALAATVNRPALDRLEKGFSKGSFADDPALFDHVTRSALQKRNPVTKEMVTEIDRHDHGSGLAVTTAVIKMLGKPKNIVCGDDLVLSTCNYQFSKADRFLLAFITLNNGAISELRYIYVMRN
jgi:hypothetical protein